MKHTPRKLKITSLFKLIRLHKPTGALVLWWPTAWALWVVTQGSQLHLWGLFFLGSIIMRSAGCIWNDVSDADIDPYVERTANRPIATGEISILEALICLTLLLTIAAYIALQLPKEAFLLCFVAVGLTILYPLTKRFFKAPQIFLGLAFAMSVPIAFAAQNQLNNPICFWLYCSAFLWPLVYDTIYALSDKKDDSALNIHSLPLTLGSYTNMFIDYCQSLFISALLITGYFAKASFIYYAFLFLYAIIVMAQQIKLRTSNKYQTFFSSYQWLGAIIMLGFVFGISS